MLYIINNEQIYFNINWKEKLIQTISESNKGVNVLDFFKNICENLFNNETSILDYKLYIAMNRLDIPYNLNFYKEIQKNTSHLKFIHNLIDLVNKAKCKLFNIKYIQKIYKL
ncbi:hypothetical protein NAPIS_ORF00097 [Vairimorpha apis BRL 01]|uniref:Uncharacterized protein n=1 Tax=Vairimorpha apis BRL 01 TaxID=1037528 RepID=T0MMW2_9MICR|nr:hypothetical protein NAPIS_ORF00097 [Vairimorpha apis BRL 01]